MLILYWLFIKCMKKQLWSNIGILWETQYEWFILPLLWILIENILSVLPGITKSMGEERKE